MLCKSYTVARFDELQTRADPEKSKWGKQLFKMLHRENIPKILFFLWIWCWRGGYYCTDLGRAAYENKWCQEMPLAERQHWNSFVIGWWLYTFFSINLVSSWAWTLQIINSCSVNVAFFYFKLQISFFIEHKLEIRSYSWSGLFMRRNRIEKDSTFTTVKIFFFGSEERKEKKREERKKW